MKSYPTEVIDKVLALTIAPRFLLKLQQIKYNSPLCSVSKIQDEAHRFALGRGLGVLLTQDHNNDLSMVEFTHHCLCTAARVMNHNKGTSLWEKRKILQMKTSSSQHCTLAVFPPIYFRDTLLKIHAQKIYLFTMN